MSNMILQISIITFNICGINPVSRKTFSKIKKIAEIINAENVDIINLQEIIFYHHLWFLQKLLPNFPFVIYKPSALGPHAGLVTFSRLPLKIREFKKFNKNGDLLNLSIIHVLAQRGMLISKLTNTNIEIINTHFSSNMSNVWKTENHYTNVLRIQSYDLNQLIKSEKGKTFLITGDFNIPKNTDLYKCLATDHLIDIFQNINKATHLGDFFFDKTSNLQIDYIFTSKALNQQISTVYKKFMFDQKVSFGSKKEHLSDHIGLEACINIESV